MNDMWQVVIIDIHPTSMLGSKLILEEQQDLVVKGMGSTAAEGLELVRAYQPELIMMDYKLPDASAENVITDMIRVSPESHILIMTDEDNAGLFQQLLAAGASGSMSKQASPMQLMHMIRGLRQGMLSVPMDWMRGGQWPFTPILDEKFAELTETEIFIMERIVQGITYDKIAIELAVSRRSIDNYLRKIYAKLGVASRAQAIEKYALYARQQKQIYA
ncbi:response regulator transcription factor [Paenibacillus sp. JX-17]|uniref:Response regulator transcription factor n=1 Tax=Paenibacillus lacisoli TaxID=3064525 RepID=A0ABT9CDK0_9BACL|nr:response regulator transcription factor [Paenibacillus sp. JX-17]MDO7907353.1 response regulator transcription factor [Paenibacillus sp. JX-17]